MNQPLPSFRRVPHISRAAIFLGAAAFSSAFAPTSLVAAPNAAATNLTFNVTARFSYHDADESTPDPEQVINAKFALGGKKMRVESALAGRPIVVIVNPPYAYRLLPGSKTGVRYRASSGDWGSKMLGGPNLLTSPAGIRAALQREGARRIGSAKLNGVPVDVYTATSFRGQKGQIKAWLRRSDALPLRFELRSRKLSATASWRNYQRGRVLPASLFAPPKGYRLRDGEMAGR